MNAHDYSYPIGLMMVEIQTSKCTINLRPY